MKRSDNKKDKEDDQSNDIKEWYEKSYGHLANKLLPKKELEID